MSKVTWLPPLNSHNNFITTVHVVHEHTSITEHQNTLPKSLSLELNVRVIFHSEDIKNFVGLSISQSFLFPSSCEFEYLISDFVLDEKYVPFQLDGANYYEIQIMPSHRQGVLMLVTRDVIVERISDFLQVLVSDTTIAGLETIHASLFIEKSIELPKDELQAWKAWYDEQDMAYPSFAREFYEAITRPRTEEELWEEVIMNCSYNSANKSAIEALERVIFELDQDNKDCHDMKPCSICLEDMDGMARKMSCSHVFHEECIVRWLKTSHMCPLCRYVLPTAC